MKVSKPDDIVLERLNYNSRTPQQYFDELSERLSAFDVIFRGFIIEEKWKGNSTLTSFEYDGVVYNNYRINKLYRYIKRIEQNGFVKPKGLILTPEILTQKVLEECKRRDNIEFIGYDTYNGARTYLKLRCNIHDYTWDSTIYDTFMNKHSNCSKCSGVYCYTIDELNDNILNKSIYSRITTTPITKETYNGVFSKVKLECECGLKWEMTYDNFMRDRGCPLCTDISYKNGYNSNNIPSNFYILEIYDENSSLLGYKFGISKNVKNRMYSYNKTCRYNLKVNTCIYFDRCNDAFLLEKKIKSQIRGRYLTKDMFGEGWTETISVDMYDKIIDIIEKRSQ